MTRMNRWLSALVLLLAFGAVAVRAEEEEAPPHVRRTAELLPAPQPAAAYVPQLVWPSDEPGVWHFPSPCPVPIPCPLAPAFFAPCGEGSGACTYPASCACPGCPLCAAQAPEGVEYVVEMKMVKAGADGEETVKACPRLAVLENQTATVELCGVQSSKEQCSLRMQSTVAKTAKGVVLDLLVTDSCNIAGELGLRSHTATTETRCPVLLGKATKMELTHDADGVCTAWVVVTVTEVEREELAPRVASARTCPKSKVVSEEEEEAAGARLDDVVEFIQDCFDMGAEAAYTLSGSHSNAVACAPPSSEYVLCPPYGTEPVSRGCGMPATCTQCVAVESAKQPTMHVSIDASHDRKCVEMSDGKKHFKASADQLTMHDGCIELQGDVCAESCDDSCNDCTVIKADKVRVEPKDGGLKIQVDGAGKLQISK